MKNLKLIWNILFSRAHATLQFKDAPTEGDTIKVGYMKATFAPFINSREELVLYSKSKQLLNIEPTLYVDQVGPILSSEIRSAFSLGPIPGPLAEIPVPSFYCGVKLLRR